MHSQRGASLPEDAQKAIAAADEAWYRGDYAEAAKLVAGAAKHLDHETLERWKGRFQDTGAEILRVLLKTLLDVDPEDDCARLELLSLAEDPLEGEEAARALESLLRQDARVPYQLRGKGLRAAVPATWRTGLCVFTSGREPSATCARWGCG
jgi:hypothetical protein